jgi:hypothetical protein
MLALRFIQGIGVGGEWGSEGAGQGLSSFRRQ